MYDDKAYTSQLITEIKKEKLNLSLMEVCGTHTMAIARSGVKKLFPHNLRLLSGPGCPVCVTSQGDIDAVIELATKPGVILATFGDMIRVPGSNSSLQEAKSRGADIRVVYSPLDALRLAKHYPEKEVVFLGIGFETTAPAIAITIEEACRQHLQNFSVWSLHKVVSPALEVIFSDSEITVDGLICPGHVAAVTGIDPFIKLADKYKKPCVVTGFETPDILEGIYMLLLQLRNSDARAEIQYQSVVKPQGNIEAMQVMQKVFKTVPSRWRGLGVIEDSGLAIKDEYCGWDARTKFNIPEYEVQPVKGCACGDVLKGKIVPHQCALFAKVCTPLTPVGPCMVSQEGACAAYYRYNSAETRAN